MKSWASIYSLFARVIGRIAVLYVFSCSVLIILVERLFSEGKIANPDSISAIPSGVSFVVFILGIFWLIPKNYSWLMLLPIPKRQLILLQGLVNITFMLVMVISHFSIVAISQFVLLGKFVQFWSTIDSINAAYLFLSKNAGALFRKNPYEPMLYAPLFLGSLLSIFFLFGSVGTINRQRLSFSRWPNKAWLLANQRGIAKFIAFIVLVILFQNYILSSFGIFAIFTFGFANAIPGTWIGNLALAGRSARVSRNIFLAVGIVQIAILYGVALAKMNRDSESRVQAMLFLGAFAGHPNPAEFARLLESDLSWSSGKELGARYLAEFNDGKLLNRATEGNLKFENLIDSKKTKEGIYAAYQFYNPSTLNLNDLQTIYNGLERTKDDGNDWAVFLRFINAQVSLAEMQKLFQSKKPWEVTYALLRARYERKAPYTGYVLENLSRYSGKTLLVALDTLSILIGTRITLEDWHTFRNGRGIAQSSLEFECAAYSPLPVTELKAGDIGRLNICLRQAANRKDTHLLRDIEALGWIDYPLTSQSTWIVSRVFPQTK